MAKKRSKRNVLDIGYGGEPQRGTTIGLDDDEFEVRWDPSNPTYSGHYGRSLTEPLEQFQADALHLPFRTSSLDRTTSQDAWQHDFPSKGTDKAYSQDYILDFDPEEHWASLIESLRVLKPGGTTKHVWDGVLGDPIRKDPYYIALIQLLKNHDMENIKLRLEPITWSGDPTGDIGAKAASEELGYPVREYYFHLTARKKR